MSPRMKRVIKHKAREISAELHVLFCSHWDISVRENSTGMNGNFMAIHANITHIFWQGYLRIKLIKKAFR